MSLKCILFAEFDVKIGPCLVAQSPEKYLSKEQFGLVDKYLITKPELSDRLLTIRSLGEPIISCPVKIDGKQYPRNYLLFNVSLVLSADADTALYEPVVKKLAFYFRSLEVDSGFIVNEAKSKLQGIFDQVYTSLNREGWCSVPLADAAVIRLQLVSKQNPQPAVKPSEVPVPLTNLDAIPRGRLDWTLVEILPHINGVNFAKKIAVNADVALDLVLKALRCLVAMKLVAMVPAFQYSSIYVVTGKVGRLLDDPALQRRCEISTRCGAEGSGQGGEKLFSLYCDLIPRSPYWTVADFNERHGLGRLGIDPRRFVYFGVIEGLLRKVSRFPTRFVPDTDFTDDRVLTDFVPPSMLEGKHSTDEICCETGLSARQLVDLLDADPYCDYFYR